MSFFKFNKKTNEVIFEPITVPTSWDEITLGKYNELQAYYKSLEDKENIDMIKLISILTDKKEDDINLLPAIFIKKILDKLDFLKEIKFNDEISNKILIDGEEYIINNMEDLTFGEWVDVNTSLNNEPDNLIPILAILCRKKGELYDTQYQNKIFDDRLKMFSNISVIDGLKIINFFFHLSEVYMNSSPDCTNQVKQQLNQYAKDIEDSIENGDYYLPYTFYLRRKLRKLQQSLNKIS